MPTGRPAPGMDVRPIPEGPNATGARVEPWPGNPNNGASGTDELCRDVNQLQLGNDELREMHEDVLLDWFDVRNLNKRLRAEIADLEARLIGDETNTSLPDKLHDEIHDYATVSVAIHRNRGSRLRSLDLNEAYEHYDAHEHFIDADL